MRPLVLSLLLSVVSLEPLKAEQMYYGLPETAYMAADCATYYEAISEVILANPELGLDSKESTKAAKALALAAYKLAPSDKSDIVNQMMKEGIIQDQESLRDFLKTWNSGYFHYGNSCQNTYSDIQALMDSTQ